MKGYLPYAVTTALALYIASTGIHAQDNNPSPPVVTNQPPVVTVLATNPNASEDGPIPATFQVTRAGATNNSLTVLYSLGGSARNGRDYEF